MQRALPSAGPTIAGMPQPGPNGPGGSLPPGGFPAGGMPPGAAHISTAQTMQLPVKPPSLPPGEQRPVAPEQPGEEHVSRTRPFRGWYPRWWLLSAFFCSCLIGLVLLLQLNLCSGTSTDSNACQFTNWQNDWRQVAVVGVLWVVFLLIWLLTYIFGVRPVEFKRSHHPFALFIRSISEFRAIYPLIMFYGIVAFLIILLMCYEKKVSTLVFTLCSIVLFVANSYFFYPMQPRERNRYVLGYAVLAGAFMYLMFRLNILQPVLFVAEVLLLLAGLRSVVALFRRSAAPTLDPNLPPDQRLARTNEEALEPGEVFMDLLRSFRRRNANE